MSDVIRINFQRAIPIFPLSRPVLLPHAVQPLHIFEPRYRQMVADALDSDRLIAMATYDGCCLETPSDEAAVTPGIRPAVCIGRIIDHQPYANGRSNILLQGVCRAMIDAIEPPNDDRLYGIVRLHPLEKLDEQASPMPEVRDALRRMLTRPTLARLHTVPVLMEWFDDQEVSTHALIELIGFTLVQNDELKYRLLAEAKPERRAEMVEAELRDLDVLIDRASRQNAETWPKGMSWN